MPAIFNCGRRHEAAAALCREGDRGGSVSSYLPTRNAHQAELTVAQFINAVPDTRAEATARYRRGALLVAGAAVAWSTAGLITRATTTDAWTTLFWRSLFSTLFLISYIALRDRGRAFRAFRALGLPALGIAVSFGTSMMCFIIALKQTSVANVLIFQAAAPFVAAVLAWLWLRERLSPRSALAILATVVGIAVMESDSLAKGRLWGDLFSAVMGLSFAVMIVLARRHRDVSMTSAMCLATALTCLVTLPFAELAVAPDDLALLAMFGVGQMGLGLVMFTAGVRLIPAADAGLITVLEVILAPIWVWLAFGENPGTRAMLGGAIVLGSIVAHTFWEKQAIGKTAA
jgi:drug/metabolite transporter (DMT)-like permease